jgi:hypothetical protein
MANEDGSAEEAEVDEEEKTRTVSTKNAEPF